MHRWSILVLLGSLAASCGGQSASDYQKKAQAALDGGDAPRAIEVVTEALQQDAVRKDAPAAWRLERSLSIERWAASTLLSDWSTC